MYFLRGRSPSKARIYLVLGIAYGILMGIARMAQGGHFASDILWAWGVTHFTALLIAHRIKL